MLDKFGVTESNSIKVDVITNFKTEKEFNRLVQKIEELDKDPVQVDLYLKAHGLEQVEGLKDYILNNDKLNMGSVNELIASQNNKNIANQAHGYKGVKKAIDEYNKSVGVSKEKADALTTAISNSNAKLGNHLTSLNNAKATMRGYALSLATATAGITTP